MIHHIDTTTSTNDDARDPQYRHGDIVWAEHQTAGRGQRGHQWISPEGENLTFTMVVEPSFLPVGQQFLLCEAMSAALTDTFAAYGIDTRIKWTNDIYAGDRKLVGVLIEHNYSGANLSRSLLGIGINVNQTAFDPSLPNPISMAQLTGRRYDRREVLETFERCMLARYEELEHGDRETLQRIYRERMYALGQMRPFRRPDGTLLHGAIEGVRPSGELILRHDDGSHGEYLFKEIEFVLPHQPGFE